MPTRSIRNGIHPVCKHRPRSYFVRNVHLYCFVPCWQELAEEHEGELRVEEVKKLSTKEPAQVRIACVYVRVCVLLIVFSPLNMSVHVCMHVRCHAN